MEPIKVGYSVERHSGRDIIVPIDLESGRPIGRVMRVSVTDAVDEQTTMTVTFYVDGYQPAERMPGE